MSTRLDQKRTLVTGDNSGIGAAIALGLADAAGAPLLLRQGGTSANLGWVLLSSWLVVQGSMALLNVSLGQSGAMAVLALAAGVLILLRR